MLNLISSEESFSIHYNKQLRLFHHNSDLPILFLGEGSAEYSEYKGIFNIKETKISKKRFINFDDAAGRPRIQTLRLYFFIPLYRFLNSRLELSFCRETKKFFGPGSIKASSWLPVGFRRIPGDFSGKTCFVRD